MPASADAIRAGVAACAAADDKKAGNLLLLDVGDLLGIVDLFALASVNNERQIKAVLDAIEERLRDQDRKPLRREGTPESGWVLLDYGDLVVHVFLEEQRGLYALERLWADVPRIDPVTGAPVVLDDAPA